MKNKQTAGGKAVKGVMRALAFERKLKKLSEQREIKKAQERRK